MSEPKKYDDGWPWYAKFALQAGATGVVCLLLYMSQREFSFWRADISATHRDDLRAFRDELVMQRKHDETLRAITNDLIRLNQQSIQRTQEDIASTLKVVVELAREVRSMKSGAMHNDKPIGVECHCAAGESCRCGAGCNCLLGRKRTGAWQRN